MRTRPTIDSIEIIEFEYEMADVGAEPTIGLPVYKPGARAARRANAVRIRSDSGPVGEYVGGSAPDYAVIPMLAPTLIGRCALNREDIYNDTKQATRQLARMGVGVLDMALWDLAGKYYDAPVYELLGGTGKKLPCYASTYVGDHEEGGLSSPEAYADFARSTSSWAVPGRSSRATPAHTWAIMRRVGSAAPRRTPTSRSSASRWDIRRSKSTGGRTRRSTSRSRWYTLSEDGSAAGWT